MALEAVVYPKPQDPFGYSCNKDIYSLPGEGGGAWGYDFCFQQEDRTLLGIIDANIIEQGLHANWDSSSSPSIMQHANESWGPNSSPDAYAADQTLSAGSFSPAAAATTGGRRKRRRTKSSKNKEEIENQRMTHIAVERNRRKQMNEYLAILRSLMPPSYVQRGDQASVIGGSINFVKELEQLLQSMEAQKRNTSQLLKAGDNGVSSPFADFFTFPQFSTRASQSNNLAPDHDSSMTENVADIEVNMAESHANIKILTKKRPRQLLKMVASFQNLRLSVLHLNVSTVDQMVLYSVSVKVEEGSQLNTVDEIAAAVHQILLEIEEEATAFS
ncbi:hypothetical protein AB3S75_011870 [Citrus x aurantiifolia]